VRLRKDLSDIATLHYVDGPPMGGRGGSRPWWILGSDLEHDTSDDRWTQTVQWWSEELSKNQYDGVIGLSQGSAMTALLVSMLSHPERVPGFNPKLSQPIKFAIFCSGFISHYSPHKGIYSIPDDLPTLHTVDDNDFIVPARRTIELKEMCKTSILSRHNEGHSIPVRGDWPKFFKDFITNAVAVKKDSHESHGHDSHAYE